MNGAPRYSGRAEGMTDPALGWGWGSASQRGWHAGLPHPNPSPEGEGL